MHPILTYEQLKPITCGKNNEPMVSVKKYSNDIQVSYVLSDMYHITGKEIYVRETVAKKLANVQTGLHKKIPEASLRVVYGYRHPEVQLKYFVEMKKKIKQERPELNETELVSYVHNFIAVPDVAGHPTGGAVDLTIVLGSEEIDMGGRVEDFSDIETMVTDSKKISPEAKQNRFILHDLMIQENFAPFYGEWWHFSYGDKEWACFYNQKESIYSPIDYRTE